jgi:glucosyl-3-phosphoglycerate synthase
VLRHHRPQGRIIIVAVVGGRNGHARFTFAVVGRDEARTLPGVIEQARQAAGPGDEVWFVDSASRDNSVELARELGVEVIEGGPGKGHAMAAALARCQLDYICFIDADLYLWETNVPAALRQAVLSSGAEMVVGSFTNRRVRMITPLIYWPLVDLLFPDYGRVSDPVPMSGLRALATRAGPDGLPDGYGVETYLNLAVAAAGARVTVTHLGEVRDSLRGYANVREVGEAVIRTILDFAVAAERLTAEGKGILEAWALALLSAMATAAAAGSANPAELARRHPFPRLKP